MEDGGSDGIKVSIEFVNGLYEFVFILVSQCVKVTHRTDVGEKDVVLFVSRRVEKFLEAVERSFSGPDEHTRFEMVQLLVCLFIVNRECIVNVLNQKHFTTTDFRLSIHHAHHLRRAVVQQQTLQPLNFDNAIQVFTHGTVGIERRAS